MINRSFAWIDENEEHTDADYARVKALAKKWSELQTIEENRHFRQMADYDDPNCYDPFEDCECEYCLKNNHSCNYDGPEKSCTLCSIEIQATECVARAEWQKEQDEKQAERDLEIELVEDKLAALGARMARPYEHWNEDERYMEYMENRSDYSY